MASHKLDIFLVGESFQKQNFKSNLSFFTDKTDNLFKLAKC